MNTAVINIKTDQKVKTQAQKLAEDMGISLTSVINLYLKHFIKTKSVTFNTKNEMPSKYLINTLKKAEKNLNEGKASPTFDNSKDAIKWLEKQGI